MVKNIFFETFILLASFLLYSCQNNVKEKKELLHYKQKTNKTHIDSLIQKEDPTFYSDTTNKVIDLKNGFRRLKFGISLDSIDLNGRPFKYDTINHKLQRIWLDTPLHFDIEYNSTVELTFLDKKLVWIKIRFNDTNQPFLLRRLKLIFENSIVIEKREIKEFTNEEIYKIEKNKYYQSDLTVEKELDRLGLASKKSRYFRSIEKNRWNGEKVYIIHYKDSPPSTPKLIKNIYGKGEVNSLGNGYEYLEIGLIEYEQEIIASYEKENIEQSVKNYNMQKIEEKKFKNELMKQF